LKFVRNIVGWAGKESKSRINSPDSDKRLPKIHKTTANYAVAITKKA
jgi:hypothetical protein